MRHFGVLYLKVRILGKNDIGSARKRHSLRKGLQGLSPIDHHLSHGFLPKMPQVVGYAHQQLSLASYGPAAVHRGYHIHMPFLPPMPAPKPRCGRISLPCGGIIPRFRCPSQAFLSRLSPG